MSALSAYSEATGKAQRARESAEPEKVTITDNEMNLQRRIEWLAHQDTQSLFKKLHAEAESLLDLAIMQAVAYPTHNNHQQIINTLVRVHTLREVVNSNARVQ